MSKSLLNPAQVRCMYTETAVDSCMGLSTPEGLFHLWVRSMKSQEAFTAHATPGVRTSERLEHMHVSGHIGTCTSVAVRLHREAFQSHVTPGVYTPKRPVAPALVLVYVHPRSSIRVRDFGCRYTERLFPPTRPRCMYSRNAFLPYATPGVGTPERLFPRTRPRVYVDPECFSPVHDSGCRYTREAFPPFTTSGVCTAGTLFLAHDFRCMYTGEGLFLLQEEEVDSGQKN